MKAEMMAIIQFLGRAEKLKTVLRHSWTSEKSRQESTAEHSWMVCLLAMCIFKYLKHPVDELKVLKFLIIHDLAEAVTGDVPTFDKYAEGNTVDHTAGERKAFHDLCSELPEGVKKEMVELFEEYEARKSYEAKVAKAVEVLEARIQHEISDISTWGQGDYSIAAFFKEELFEFDDFIRELKEVVDFRTMQKLEKDGDLSRLAPDKMELYEKLKTGDND